MRHNSFGVFQKSVVLLFIGLISMPLNGRIWIVDTTGAEGDSLQAAIDSAWAVPGIDTVLVKNGTYHLAINLDTLIFNSDTSIGFIGLIMRDSVRLMSENGAESCTLTAISQDLKDTAWHVIWCEHIRDVEIEGFSIMNGKAVGPSNHRCGGGVCIEGSSSITLRNNRIENNYAGSGAGVMARDKSEIVLINNVVANNSAYDFGAGILIYKRSSATLIGNIVENNVTAIDGFGDGGGVLISMASATLIGNIITGNYGGYGGGGVHPAASKVELYNNIIRNNRAAHGAGVWIIRGGKTYLDNNIIEDNIATAAGGGICILQAPAISANNVIKNNSARHGGGIWLYNSSAEFNNDMIVNNSSEEDGGGISAWAYSSAVFKKCVIVANKGKFGGAIYDSLHSKVVIDSCFIVDNGNTADDKSGLAYIASNADSGETFKISNSNLYYNTYQSDTEIYNLTSITVPLKSNFWWYTTKEKISKLILGPNDHSLWQDDFIPNVPSEPLVIDSIRNYDSTYSSVVDTLNQPDTLYIRVYGVDRNADLREAAVIIIKSEIYPSGIVVALTETDKNSGIYQGKAYVLESKGENKIRIDDIHQSIKVDSIGDLIQIFSNVDTTKKFEVVYKEGIGPSEFAISQNFPNPFIDRTMIKYQLPEDCWVKINIYNIVGQHVRTLVNKHQKSGYYEVIWDAKSDEGKKLPSGIYFYTIQANKYKMIKKAIIIK